MSIQWKRKAVAMVSIVLAGCAVVSCSSSDSDNGTDTSETSTQTSGPDANGADGYDGATGQAGPDGVSRGLVAMPTVGMVATAVMPDRRVVSKAVTVAMEVSPGVLQA